MTSTFGEQKFSPYNTKEPLSNNGKKNETLPFLSEQKSVTLTPSWESQKLTNDELNLKGVTLHNAQMSIKPPIDKWRIVLFIFLLHGLGTLMPWNMFINAKSYFQDFKLNTTSNETLTYSTNFMQYIGFASQIPNLIFNWLNIFVHLGGDLTKRIVYSIIFEVVIFITTVILAMIDSSDWAVPFFWITLISVILLNMANGIYQNTIYGMVAILPIQYTGIVVLGSNISGCFASIMNICSSLIFTSERTAAIYYFITAILILLVCFDTYFALPLNKFFRYHHMLSEKEAMKKTDIVQNSGIPYWQIFKQASPQLFNIFFTFFVTLAVFPAIHSDIKRKENSEFFIPDKLFTSVTCFLTFNAFAMFGSLATSWIQWPNSKFLVIPVSLRVVFIPLFLFCNYIPKNITRTLPVLIDNEWIYWFLAVIMSFSSGYLSSLGMMYAPQTVAPKHQITAGMFAAAMLITGIFSGIMFSFIYPVLI